MSYASKGLQKPPLQVTLLQPNRFLLREDGQQNDMSIPVSGNLLKPS